MVRPPVVSPVVSPLQTPPNLDGRTVRETLCPIPARRHGLVWKRFMDSPTSPHMCKAKAVDKTSDRWYNQDEKESNRPIDDYLPIATYRLYPIDCKNMMLGRILVLPGYRRKGIGRMTVASAEKWAKEFGYKNIVFEHGTISMPHIPTENRR